MRTSVLSRCMHLENQTYHHCQWWQIPVDLLVLWYNCRQTQSGRKILLIHGADHQWYWGIHSADSWQAHLRAGRHTPRGDWSPLEKQYWDNEKNKLKIWVKPPEIQNENESSILNLGIGDAPIQLIWRVYPFSLCAGNVALYGQYACISQSCQDWVTQQRTCQISSKGRLHICVLTPWNLFL